MVTGITLYSLIGTHLALSAGFRMISWEGADSLSPLTTECSHAYYPTKYVQWLGSAFFLLSDVFNQAISGQQPAPICLPSSTLSGSPICGCVVAHSLRKM